MWCFPDQLPADFRKDLIESLPGSGDVNIPIDPENWMTITDGMAEVTQPGYFHTAGSAHLEGIDLAGKTGTAQVMSHEALGQTNKGSTHARMSGSSASRRGAIRSWWSRCFGRTASSAIIRRGLVRGLWRHMWKSSGGWRTTLFRRRLRRGGAG